MPTCWRSSRKASKWQPASGPAFRFAVKAGQLGRNSIPRLQEAAFVRAAFCIMSVAEGRDWVCCFPTSRSQGVSNEKDSGIID
jgi:hypothetical protein